MTDRPNGWLRGARGLIPTLALVVVFSSPAPPAPPADTPAAKTDATTTPNPNLASTPVPAPKPAPTKAEATSIRVATIPALLAGLANPDVTEIVVVDGTYRVSAAGDQAPDSLWIGSQFAARTRPVTVRAETRGGVTFDGGGTDDFGCLSFEAGAHDQTWDGFTCAGGQATSTGVVTFGGYAGLAAAHHISIRNLTIVATCTGRATTVSGSPSDHAIYVSEAIGGPHDLVFEDLAIDGRGGLASAFHFFHSNGANKNAWNVTVRRLHVIGTQQAIMLADSTLHDITFDTVDITGALDVAVRYESPGATGITIRNLTSRGSGSGAGFYSSMGSSPPGLTLSRDTFD